MRQMAAFVLAAVLMLGAGGAAMAGTAPAAADNPAIALCQPVIDALQQQGYRIVSVNTTWLNRVRIRAQNDYVLREIVVSPASGDILRDAIVTQLKPLPKANPESQTFIPLPPPSGTTGAGH